MAVALTVPCTHPCCLACFPAVTPGGRGNKALCVSVVGRLR